jgi:UDP-GlcNAc:undecaprenyl-phosphate/decaprenyl-phosphate GlcNAc-1-phosphate transferase
MTAELSAAVGLASAAFASFAATPVAIRVARRTGFYDQPRGYRKHSAPTPFLGGAAVTLGVFVAAAAVGGLSGRLLLLLALGGGMWALGTADDRFAVAPKWRVLAAALAATALTAAGLGWETDGGETADTVLTILWVVGLVNAFNLMDNMDGACGSVGCVSATGVGTLAAIHGESTLAGLSFGLAGACIGFLPWNLAGPAKIFLGDGGSMVVGFFVAVLAMATVHPLAGGDSRVLAGGLLVGISVLDTSLVILSRFRRRIPLVTGGRDHLTHRLLLRLRTPGAVAAALATSQVVLCVLAILAVQLGPGALLALAMPLIALGLIVILVLDGEQWRPVGIASARPHESTAPAASREFETAHVERL